MEATLVITIAAVLSSVAIATSSDTADDANISNSNGEVKLIGVSILSFMQDTGVAPAYWVGTNTGPNDTWIKILQSEGSDPHDATGTWPTAGDDRDSLDNHLNRNTPGGSLPYVRIGELSYARFKGWNGPYMSQIPAGDPWGDKYLCNIGFLTSQGAQTANLTAGRKPAVFVISAGANHTLETKYFQYADEFEAGGDDLVFRIQ